MKHTPGPWKVLGNTTVYVGKGIISGEPKEGLKETAIPFHIVRIYQDEKGRRCTQYIATLNIHGAMPNGDNAKLIAAAPDLLEALTHGYTYFIQDNKLTADDREILDEMWAAICKARGEIA